MAVSVLQPLSTSDYSLPSLNIDEYQQEKMSSKLLITSPYPSPEHHLDLSSVPETSQQLALALEILRPVTEEYPSQPYSTSFNWQEVVDRLPADFTGTFVPRLTNIIGEFYCIAFYSKLHPHVDTTRLHYLDSLAHAEANQSGGLLKYWWKGPPDESTRKNLATCIWTTWDHAKRAGRLPMHAVAMSATRDSYAKWNVERYYLKIASGNKWELERITL
jgi:hypothetical protein